jgi:hypothetical protein
MTYHNQHFHHHDQMAIQRIVAHQGFALFHGGGRRGWTHTIGLYDSQHRRPQLFICGLTLELRVQRLLDLGFQINGPPSPEMIQQKAQELDISASRLWYPPGGRVFEPGRIYRLAHGELPGCFCQVEQRYFERFLWHACAYHEHADFPVLQYTWSDPAGRFPWEETCDPRARQSQILLFDPRQYLSLSEEA